MFLVEFAIPAAKLLWFLTKKIMLRGRRLGGRRKQGVFDVAAQDVPH
jgi:hypothetical protein